MCFKKVKSKVISLLQDGLYVHQVRGAIDTKNLFCCGEVTENDVIDLIKITRGDQYEVRPHHQDETLAVHIMKPVKNNQKWYIKFCFIEPNALFISVHKSGV